VTDTTRPLSDSDIRQIAALMEALDRSGFDTLQIETGDLKLSLSKGGGTAFSATAVAPAPTAADALASTPASAPRSAAPPPSVVAAPAHKPPKAAAPADDGTVAIRSPIMGQFYSRPDPSAPPFVTLGSPVEPETTVALVEVMKVFNAITAGVKGEVAEICAQDAETIELGQILFKIRPAAEPAR
jgi:acetyl-CoA carboxylase biotin carboxyl carrier protein